VNKPDHGVLKDFEWLEGAMCGRKQAYVLVGLFIGVLAFLPMSGPVIAQSQKIGDPPEFSDMRLVGFSDLQGRSAYQPTIHHQGNRWIVYIGHHGGTNATPKPVNPLTGQPEFSGTSIIDVTDPAHPKYLAHIPGQEGNYERWGRADGARVRWPQSSQG
jgi:hypothetical protein